jgi:hypothetical protein
MIPGSVASGMIIATSRHDTSCTTEVLMYEVQVQPRRFLGVDASEQAFTKGTGEKT